MRQVDPGHPRADPAIGNPRGAYGLANIGDQCGVPALVIACLGHDAEGVLCQAAGTVTPNGWGTQGSADLLHQHRSAIRRQLPGGSGQAVQVQQLKLPGPETVGTGAAGRVLQGLPRQQTSRHVARRLLRGQRGRQNRDAEKHPINRVRQPAAPEQHPNAGVFCARHAQHGRVDPPEPPDLFEQPMNQSPIGRCHNVENRFIGQRIHRKPQDRLRRAGSGDDPAVDASLDQQVRRGKREGHMPIPFQPHRLDRPGRGSAR